MDAWLQDGSLLVDDDGAIALCDECPCDLGPPPPEPCCVDGPVQTVYMWLARYQPPPPSTFGCAATICDLNTTSSYLSERVGLPFPFNDAAQPTIDTAAGCFQVRFRGECTAGSAYIQHMDVDAGFGFQGEHTLATGICPAAAITLPQCGTYLPDASDFTTYYLSADDPADGIHVPDGTVVLPNLTFSITLTLAGVPTLYTANLRFTPLINRIESGNLCYAWIGWLTDCNGICVEVQLDFVAAPLFPRTKKWRLSARWAIGHAPITVYLDNVFAASGNSAEDWSADCGTAGVFPPWSLT